MEVVTRFAPSPTGFVHIGGVRTALFAYLFARKHGGTFILRIEDTDKDREVPGSVKHIMESLSWLGLVWDYGPDKLGPFGSSIQSERLETYRDAAKKLAALGLAYPDPYTEEEVERMRTKAQDEKRPFLFREHRPNTFGEWDGKTTLRFKVPVVKRYNWMDAVRGQLEAGEEALDDFILLKSDGYPTYNFAHIIDDLNMGVTHILRADEFISSTPKFLSLYDALDIEPPVFVTLPPILGPDGKKKLSKRDGAKDILDYQKEGYLPEAMINFLALIGWNPGTDEEIFNIDELVERFTIDQIQVHGGIMNDEKLRWFNREHLLRLSDDAFKQYAREFLSEHTVSTIDTSGLWDSLIPVMRERIHTFAELKTMDEAGEFSYYASAPDYADASKLVWKNDVGTLNATAEHLERVATIAGSIGSWSKESLESAIMPYAEEKGKGSVLWPMRYALSGKDKSPDPFTIAGIIGKNETIHRLQRARDALQGVR